MVRRLPPDLQKTGRTEKPLGRLLHQVLMFLEREMVRAGAGDEEPSRLQGFDGQVIETTVISKAGGKM